MAEDYHVSEKTRKLWSIQLDLLKKLKSICIKHGLTFFACGGTLLGAARHKGFIPWDDDIDVALMWPDYRKLLEVAPKECQYPYFFQSYLTEKEGEINACRLRRSDTTGYTKWEHDNVGDSYNTGIFIDIFPLFYVPDDIEVRAVQREKVLSYWKCVRGFNALRRQIEGKTVNEEYRSYIPDYEKLAETMSIEQMKTAYLEACAMVNYPQKEIGATATRIHLPELMWNTEWFAPFVELPFEDNSILCPSCYDEVLTKQYGDWRTPVMNTAVHEMYFVDTETPYTEYIKKSKE